MKKLLCIMLLSTVSFAQSNIWIESSKFSSISFYDETEKTECPNIETEGDVSTYRRGNLKLELEFIPNVYDGNGIPSSIADRYIFGYVRLKDLGKVKATAGTVTLEYVLTDGVTKQYVRSTTFYRGADFSFSVTPTVADQPNFVGGRLSLALFPQNSGVVECQVSSYELSVKRLGIIYGRLKLPGREVQSREERE